MFYNDKKLQYPVRVNKPDPRFARMLQQAIGGIEGEMRVCLQYLFQAWNCRGAEKYRDILLQTGTEEIGHIEMLATAVALNLENAPVELQEEAATSKIIEAAMGGNKDMLAAMDPRHILSAGLGAMAADANGVPFNGSWIVSSGNIAADMYANVMAESTGRCLACRLHQMTDDPGMKDMLSFLIARDTMHQNQWLAVLEDLEAEGQVLPIPNSQSQEVEPEDYGYTFLRFDHDGAKGNLFEGRWTHGESMDGKGTFRTRQSEPLGDEPNLGFARPDVFGQTQQAKVPTETTGE